MYAYQMLIGLQPSPSANARTEFDPLVEFSWCYGPAAIKLGKGHDRPEIFR